MGDNPNKLASNIAIGHNAVGVHWDSDYIYVVLLNELVLISLLESQITYNKDYSLVLPKLDDTSKGIEE